MAEQGRPRERAQAWQPQRRARPAVAWAWPDGVLALLRGFAQDLRSWVHTDAGPGRLFPWLAVAFGFGIVLYFTASREPAPWSAVIIALVSSLVAVAARRRRVAFAVSLTVAATAAGFATAVVNCMLIEHPVLQSPVWNAQVAGFVEVQEERARSDRIVVRVHQIEGVRLTTVPERIRLSVRKGTAPAVGSFVRFKARLTPPLEPLSPGGYDFARDMYFRGIGASGFVLGRIEIATAPDKGGWWLRYAAFIDDIRATIDKRIRAILPGDKGAIASALITGKQGGISQPVTDAMFVSGIGHVLSISGYHMVVVVGIVFFAVRASFALVPGFGRFPIKKWAAVAALFAATFYLLLSGAEVATQRSFIMIAIVLAGVLADRPALTLRTLTIAAFGVLMLAPQAVVHPSFQMSFAATLALVAGYAGGVRWLSGGGDSPLGARLALWGARHAASLLLSSLVAGLATTLYAAYHFHRLAPYGVIANLLAMPVVSVLVMPMGIAGALMVPLGFDDFFWRLMGDGINWMVAVSLWVASLPGAVGRITAFGTGPLLLGTAGLLVLCLLKTPLRLSGAALLAAAALWAIRTPQPDVLVGPNGEAFAVRTTDGRLALHKTGSDTFAIQQWLAADADGRSAKDKGLDRGLSCDDDGCVPRTADGSFVAIARRSGALEEDCRRAAVLLSARAVPRDCAALVIDRAAWQRYGAIALRRTQAGWEVTAARPEGYVRPWVHRIPQNDERPLPLPSRRPRDATPDLNDLEPGE